MASASSRYSGVSLPIRLNVDLAGTVIAGEIKKLDVPRYKSIEISPGIDEVLHANIVLIL